MIQATAQRWKTYPAYKESGIEWLGQVPNEWMIKRLKFTASSTTSNVDKLTKDDEFEVFLCNYTDVYNNKFIDFSINFMPATATKTEIEKFSLVDECVIITKDSESWNDIAVPAFVPGGLEGVLCGYHLAIIKSNDINAKFLYYLLASNLINQQFQVCANGVTRFGLPQSGINNANLLIPSLDEQRAIASFLDRECVRIDALIEKKHRLLELLEEKRRAVITQAVTHGLAPSVTMKESGVEWLGEVPKLWEVKRLKFCVNSGFQYGANVAAELTDPDLPRYIRITDMNDDGTLKDDTFRSLTYEQAEPYLLRNKDILLARSGATVGKSFMYDKSMGTAAYAGYLIRISASSIIDAYYLYAFINSNSYWQWINSIFIQATIQNVSAEKYANLMLPIPSLDEQHAIVSFIDHECARIDAQRWAHEKSIALLKEYRASLITQVVTGQIDVREYEPEQ